MLWYEKDKRKVPVQPTSVREIRETAVSCQGFRVNYHHEIIMLMPGFLEKYNLIKIEKYNLA